jgi:hypothetical protein
MSRRERTPIPADDAVLELIVERAKDRRYSDEFIGALFRSHLHAINSIGYSALRKRVEELEEALTGTADWLDSYGHDVEATSLRRALHHPGVSGEK